MLSCKLFLNPTNEFESDKYFKNEVMETLGSIWLADLEKEKKESENYFPCIFLRTFSIRNEEFSNS